MKESKSHSKMRLGYGSRNMSPKLSLNNFTAGTPVKTESTGSLSSRANFRQTPLTSISPLDRNSPSPSPLDLISLPIHKKGKTSFTPSGSVGSGTISPRMTTGSNQNKRKVRQQKKKLMEKTFEVRKLRTENAELRDKIGELKTEIAGMHGFHKAAAKKDKLINKLQATLIASINTNTELRQELQSAPASQVNAPSAPGDLSEQSLRQLQDRLERILVGWEERSGIERVS